MLKFNFTRIFKSRGIDKPFSFLVKAGYSNNFATRVVNNRNERLNLKDLEKLCVLLSCTPNDLLEWIPEKTASDIANHPLISIKRSDNGISLSQIINTIPLDKLDDIVEIIKKEMEK